MSAHRNPRVAALFAMISIALSALLLFAPKRAAAETDLGGLWMETNNYPASSVIRFERSGDRWTGKYAQVSALQQIWGFNAGETVIRGTMQGDLFKGEVLLKLKPSAPEPCRDVLAFWAPIEMRLSDPGKLYGAWLQTVRDGERGNCAVIRQSWQIYGLERLRVN